MAEISDLMAGKAPGEIKVCDRDDKLVWLKPYFRDEDGDYDGYEIYTDPKPKRKIVVYDWLGNKGSIAGIQEGSEIEIITNKDYWKRLDNTRREIEVES